MRELRIQSHGDPLRIFYAFDPTRSAILLIGGNKTGQEKRFYKTMIPKQTRSTTHTSRPCKPNPNHDPLLH